MKFKVGDKVTWVDTVRYGSAVLVVVDVKLLYRDFNVVLVTGDSPDNYRGNFLLSTYFRKLTPLELALK